MPRAPTAARAFAMPQASSSNRPVEFSGLVRLAFCLCLTFGGDAARAQPDFSDAALTESANRIEADVRFLADDLLEGREAGTRGYDLAALYVATQFRSIGLRPAGEQGTYFQSVPMVRGVRQKDGAQLVVTRNGVATAFKFQEEFLPGNNYETGECSLTAAPMVFVGQGVVAPELDHDDLEGVDVRGKVAVLLSNAPSRFPTDQRAFYADYGEKARELERRGAVGVISVGDPEEEKKYPWAVWSTNWARPGMRLIGPDGRPIDTYPGLRCVAVVPAAQAEVLFAGSPYRAEAVFSMLAKDELKAFDLKGTVTMRSRTTLSRLTTRNVIGRLPAGADSSSPGETRSAGLARENVVLTAHLDHLGIGAPVGGDSIYNGAQDNALGIAAMLEAGRMLMRESSRLRRSVLLVATAAEEKGLLGAQYFATYPTVPPDSMVANVNLDMPTHIAEVTDLIPIGIEHSTLGAVTERAVRLAGLTLTPDPMPEEVSFVRSDQYPFVRAGVPAVYLWSGIKRRDGADGLEAVFDWIKQHYHKPSDDLDRPIDWLGAARLARVNYAIALDIASQEQRPAWNEGNFFGDKFGRSSR
jgi:hypothetical protein